MKRKKGFGFLRILPLLVLISLVTILFINSESSSTGKAIETASETMKTTSYIYSNGLVASYDSNGDEKFYINDHLGSGSVVLDKNGNKISEEKYYAFGEEKQDSGERFKYTGKEKDDSGLYYYGARYYDADAGRFTTPDPISGEISNPQSLNRYAYVLNNPMKFVDPSGMNYESKPDATDTDYSRAYIRKEKQDIEALADPGKIGPSPGSPEAISQETQYMRNNFGLFATIAAVEMLASMGTGKSSSANSLTPTRISKTNLLADTKLIGSGGFGDAYRRGNEVIKVFETGAIEGTRAFTRNQFLKEVKYAQLAAKLGAAPEFFGYGITADTKQYFVRVGYAGKTLGDIGFMTMEQFNQLYRIVGKLHSAGFNHGDLKASNIAITEEGKVSLIDWNNARRTSDIGRLFDYRQLQQIKEEHVR